MNSESILRAAIDRIITLTEQTHDRPYTALSAIAGIAREARWRSDHPADDVSTPTVSYPEGHKCWNVLPQNVTTSTRTTRDTSPQS